MSKKSELSFYAIDLITPVVARAGGQAPHWMTNVAKGIRNDLKKHEGKIFVKSDFLNVLEFSSIIERNQFVIATDQDKVFSVTENELPQFLA